MSDVVARLEFSIPERVVSMGMVNELSINSHGTPESNRMSQFVSDDDIASSSDFSDDDEIFKSKEVEESSPVQRIHSLVAH